MTENAVKQAFTDFVSVTVLLREEISIRLRCERREDELRHLIAVVGHL